MRHAGNIAMELASFLKLSTCRGGDGGVCCGHFFVVASLGSY